MKWRTHRLVGGVTALGVAQIAGLDAAAYIALIVPAVAVSDVPDRAERWLPFEHRTVTHHALLALLAGAALITFLVGQKPAWVPFIGVGLVLGYLMHIVADGCTPDGMPHPFRLPRATQRRTRYVRVLPFRIRITNQPPRTPGAYLCFPESVFAIIVMGTTATAVGLAYA